MTERSENEGDTVLGNTLKCSAVLEELSRSPAMLKMWENGLA